MFHIYFNAGTGKTNMLDKITFGQYYKKVLSNVMLFLNRMLVSPQNS